MSQDNLFYGKIPKKVSIDDFINSFELIIINQTFCSQTMCFETFTRIHEMELESIGDPALRHLALSKKIKTDFAVS